MSSESGPSRRRQFLLDGLVGCSLVNLMFIEIWRLLFSVGTRTAFFLTVARSHYIAALLLVAGGGVAFGLAGYVARRGPPVVQFAARIAFLATFLIVLDRVRKSTGLVLPASIMGVPHAVGTAGLLVLGIVGIGLVARFVVPLARAYRASLMFFAPFLLYTITRASFALVTQDLAPFQDLPRQAHSPRHLPGRVVMVVLDEMDYENVFVHRPTGIALPNLDALRAGSLSFDSVTAPGANTLESLTSYLLRRRVDRVEPMGPRTFMAQMSDGAKANGDSVSSIFSDVASLGGKSAIVGFSLPYCRLAIVSTADVCEWIPFGAGFTSGGALDNVSRLMRREIESLHPYDNRRSHIRRTEHAIESAVDLVGDSSFSFVFVHLPAPHLPGIWDPASHQYRANLSGEDAYGDNLALADLIVGRLRHRMEERGTWDASAVIVTSDHPLRTKLATGPSKDARIPLMIKLPEAKVSARIETPVNSLLTTYLIPRLLMGELQTPSDFTAAASSYLALNPGLLLPPKPRLP